MSNSKNKTDELISNDEIRLLPLQGLDWKALEVKPVKATGNGDGGTDYDVCKPTEADLWTVYIRLTNGEARAIADVRSQGAGERLIEWLDTFEATKWVD